VKDYLQRRYESWRRGLTHERALPLRATLSSITGITTAALVVVVWHLVTGSPRGALFNIALGLLLRGAIVLGFVAVCFLIEEL
jgi:hypothetical protein